MTSAFDADAGPRMKHRHEPLHLGSATIPEVAPHAAFRPVVSGADGSSSMAWHLEIPPGDVLPAYALANCEEIVVLLTGQGVAGQDGDLVQVRAGHCWLNRRGAKRHFRNASPTASAILVGFCPGAADLQAAGYEAADPAPEDSGPYVADFLQGVLVHLDYVSPETMDSGAGWSTSDFRLPMGAHNGSATTLFRARFLPGAIHRKHRHEACEEIYHVISGQGVAGAGGGRHAVRGGHFHYIPAGVEHWLVNHNADEPVEVVGVYIGAGRVADTGYVYCGDVTPADLE